MEVEQPLHEFVPPPALRDHANQMTYGTDILCAAVILGRRRGRDRRVIEIDENRAESILSLADDDVACMQVPMAKPGVVACTDTGAKILPQRLQERER